MKNLLKIILFLLFFTPSVYAQPSGGVTRIWDGNDIALVTAGKALLTDGSATTQPVSGGVTINAQTTGGYTPKFIAGLVGTVTSVKSSAAGTLGGWFLGNPAATICYVQIFDVATAGAVTLGTTVPVKSLMMPAGAAANVPAVAPGIAFASGIQVACTTTSTGSTPCGTGCDVNFDYK